MTGHPLSHVWLHHLLAHGTKERTQAGLINFIILFYNIKLIVVVVMIINYIR